MARSKLDLILLGEDGKAVSPGHLVSSGSCFFVASFIFILHSSLLDFFFFLTCSSFQGKFVCFFLVKPSMCNYT